MQDNPSNTNFLVPEILSNLAILAEETVRQFINRKITSTGIFSKNKSFKRILDVDVTVIIENANNLGFDLDIQVTLNLPPFVTLNENELAEEAANYALKEVEMKFIELKKSIKPYSRIKSNK
ncbi:MAG: DUF3194 domain-containing protein [Candidatus Heimdallarchaeota archaeon]